MSRLLGDAVTSGSKMAASGGGVEYKPKSKSFDYQICKKVAELTQVVHMLFTRCHQREVEIDALKHAYEEEITSVIEDAKARIARLEQAMDIMKRRDASDTNREVSKVREELLKQLKEQEEEYEKKLKERDSQIEDEKMENTRLSTLLKQSETELAKLREGKTNESSARSKELEELKAEIAQLQDLKSELTKNLEGSEAIIGDLSKQLEAIVEEHTTRTKELEELKESLLETQQIKDKLYTKNKQLEKEIERLRSQLGKRVTRESSSAQGNGRSDTAQSVRRPDTSQSVRRPDTSQSTRSTCSPSRVTFWDQRCEVDRLRDEVERYRLELINREGNFNRTFSEFQPVYVDPRSASRLRSDSPATLRIRSSHQRRDNNQRHNGYHDRPNTVHSSQRLPFFSLQPEDQNGSAATRSYPGLSQIRHQVAAPKTRPLGYKLLTGKVISDVMTTD
ncbi:uncharacterized protein LOC144885108 [Branchiostoma floridae x Branchiostoma japonicum]